MLTVVAVSVLFAVITWNRWGDLWLDSGYDLVAAAKVSHANAPYIDYDYWYGPLGPLVLRRGQLVFGIGIGPAVAAGARARVHRDRLDLRRRPAARGPGRSPPRSRCSPRFPPSPPATSDVEPHTFGAPLGVIFCLVAILAIARSRR